jgi:hypothetical protein
MGGGTINAQGLYVNGVAVSSGSGAVGANPSSGVGLTTGNGVATTFMRSDATLALSQAIVPTWTGAHTFNAQAIFKGGNNTSPGWGFFGDEDTGSFRNADGSVSFTSNGTASLAITLGRTSVLGGGTGAANTSWVEFKDVTGAVMGYVGDLSSGDSNISLNATVAGANITLTAGSGGVINMVSAAQAPSFTTTSARAVKRETGAPPKPASILARLRPILYRLLAGDDREQLGLIAEEVREVCPQLSDGKTVAYDRLAILLLAAWQDEHARAVA